MRAAFIVLALAAFTAACSPPAPPAAEKSENITASETQTDPLAIALTPALAADIGQPVTLSVETSTMDGDWGWIVARPWTADGAAFDWSQTRYAQRAADGVLDGGGTTYALLKRENGQWRVVEFVVGPTDVAYLDWPQRHGAPAALMGLPTE